MQLRYRFRLDPTPGQQAALARAFGCARVVYNDALTACRESLSVDRKWLRVSELYKRFVSEAKESPERAFLADVSSVVLQQAIRDLDRAYQNHFNSLRDKAAGRKMLPPKFKSRKDPTQAIRFIASARFRITTTRKLRLPKIGEITVRWSRDLPSEPSSVTVIKDAAGRYFASFVVVTDPDEDLERLPLPDEVAEVGIDLGVAHFAVLSDGTKVTSPKFLRRAERKLKRLQRDLCRKQKGSNNRTKARVKLAKAHAHVADSRRDFNHKLSTQLIRENQAVYVEDLNVAGLGRGFLAKPVADAAWGQFLHFLDYKAARYGRAFGKVDRFAPTSQVCSACGVSDGKKPLEVRRWTCGGCNTTHDRDVNAARNVLTLGKQLVAAGRAETLNACGGDIRPLLAVADPSEAGTH